MILFWSVLWVVWLLRKLCKIKLTFYIYVFSYFYEKKRSKNMLWYLHDLLAFYFDTPKFSAYLSSFFFSNDLSISILFCVTIKTPSQGLSIGSIKLQNSPFSSMVVYRVMMHSYVRCFVRVSKVLHSCGFLTYQVGGLHHLLTFEWRFYPSTCAFLNREEAWYLCLLLRWWA